MVRRMAPVLAVFALVLASCGGDADEGKRAGPSRPSVSASITADTAAPSTEVALVPVAAVRLEGGEFFARLSKPNDMRRGAGDVVAADTIVDGVFLPQSQQWDEGAVWWEGGEIQPGSWPKAEPRWIVLELDGAHRIESGVVQADNNDSYLLSYRDLTTGDWTRLWEVPSAGPFGMQTRPDPTNDSQRYAFTAPIDTDALRFEADSGDGMYSASEIQVYGTPLG